MKMANVELSPRFKCFSPEEREVLRCAVRRYYDDMLKDSMLFPYCEKREELMSLLSALNFEIVTTFRRDNQ